MADQHKREPLSVEETDQRVNAAETIQEKLVIFTLLDTGLRLFEFAGLTKDSILRQERRIVVLGKGGIYGKKSKRRVVPMTDRVRRVLEQFTLAKPCEAFLETITKNQRGGHYMAILTKSV